MKYTCELPAIVISVNEIGQWTILEGRNPSLLLMGRPAGPYASPSEEWVGKMIWVQYAEDDVIDGFYLRPNIERLWSLHDRIG